MVQLHNFPPLFRLVGTILIVNTCLPVRQTAEKQTKNRPVRPAVLSRKLFQPKIPGPTVSKSKIKPEILRVLLHINLVYTNHLNLSTSLVK